MTDKERIEELEKKLKKHNEFFNIFDCKDFDEFTDFISTFMLTPHEEQTLIRELENSQNAKVVEALEKIKVVCGSKINYYKELNNEVCALYDEIWRLVNKLIKEYGGKNE